MPQNKGASIRLREGEEMKHDFCAWLPRIREERGSDFGVIGSIVVPLQPSAFEWGWDVVRMYSVVKQKVGNM